MLAWSWRPREFPRGADERDSGTNDSALAVYLLVPYSRLTGPKAVKYIWSARVPVGTHLNSNYGLTQVLVLRTGDPGKDEWVEERVNALADYKKSFGESETPKPAGIAVLTASDDTKSSAQGDYANFRACRGYRVPKDNLGVDDEPDLRRLVVIHPARYGLPGATRS